jgi:hypothetical protein
MMDSGIIVPMRSKDPRAEIRLYNARQISTHVGGQAEFARRLQMSDSQASQIIGENPVKNIGNLIAHRIEDSFGYERGWLDVDRRPTAPGQARPDLAIVPTPAPPPAPPRFYIDPEEVDLINAYRSATESGRLSIRAAAAAAEKVSALVAGNEF